MDDGEIRFQQVYGEYQGKILRYLTRMVGENDTEDLNQSVIVLSELDGMSDGEIADILGLTLPASSCPRRSR